jgi:hypothetical protein
MLLKCTVLALAFLQSSIALSRDGWVQWYEGHFAGSGEYRRCAGNDGSVGAPEFWAEGYGDYPGQKAYSDTLDYVNVADRNPAYIEVWCSP